MTPDLQDLQPVLTVAAVGVLLILTAWLATIFERARHQRDVEFACEAEAAYAAMIGEDLPREQLRERLRTATAVEHVCTGCYENTTDICGSLCVSCRFDAEQATGRAWPVVEAWADEHRKDHG